MRETYSNGFHTVVYKTDRQERLWFPSADLVRIDKSEDKNWFASLFYRHKIAQLLFPDNFINIVAAQVDPWQEQLLDEFIIGEEVFRQQKSREHRLFSQMAQIPAAHAVYSAHMGFDKYEDRLEKISKHGCVDCESHRKFHVLENLERKARVASEPMLEIGIQPPTYDPSDYCLTEGGKIVFFEIDGLDRKILENFLSSLKAPTNSQREAQRLLNRFKHLREDSAVRFREALRSGIGAEIRKD